MSVLAAQMYAMKSAINIIDCRGMADIAPMLTVTQLLSSAGRRFVVVIEDALAASAIDRTTFHAPYLAIEYKDDLGAVCFAALSGRKAILCEGGMMLPQTVANGVDMIFSYGRACRALRHASVQANVPLYEACEAYQSGSGGGK